MKNNKTTSALDKAAEAIGAGIIAGLAGTVAITISQMIEMRITKRSPSTGPANAVQKTLDIEPTPGTKKRFSQQIHWVYGTTWGMFRGLLSLCGLKSWAAAGVHYGAITGTAMAMAPLEGQPPVTEWKPKELAIDLLHHAVYIAVASCVFEMITGEKD